MRAATLYQRDGKLYVHSSSKTTSGVWIMTTPVLTVTGDDLQEIGHAVRKCLAASREGIPHPVSFSKLFEPMLKVSGVRTFAAFVKRTKCVEIETADGDTVRFIPTRNEGPKEGFAPLLDTASSNLGSDSELGAAAVSALALSAD